MNRDQVLAVLRHSKPMLASQYGVRRLALFGSTARDTARDDSDVDVLVVYLVSEKALRPELRPFIEKEAVYV